MKEKKEMPFESLLPTRWTRSRFPRWATHEFEVLDNLRDEVDHLFDDFARGTTWPRLASAAGPSAECPSIDIQETGDNIIITADMPGIEKNDIDVELSDGKLTIRGTKTEEREEKRGSYVTHERHVGSVYRTMHLPCECAADKVIAEVKNGVLTVTLPKPAELKEQAKHVEVKQAA